MKEFASRMTLRWLGLVSALLLMGSTAMAQSPEELVKRQCRSIHLGYQGGAAKALYNDVTVQKSSVGTYFCVLGFNHGYFGLQERGKDKVIIFSVWDPGQQDDPQQVHAADRVRVVDHDPAVKVGRFGGEGTGGQSFLTYNWKVGETYRFCIQASTNAPFTTYTAWFYINENKAWKKLVTMQTRTGGDWLSGSYAFIEDFQRDYKSAKIQRRAAYGPAWMQTPQGQWQAFEAARFTGDVTPSTNINAGLEGSRFFLVTGGETKNELALKSIIKLPAPPPALPIEMPVAP